MIALMSIDVTPSREDYRGAVWIAREPSAEVRLKILASGADLDRLYEWLRSQMPEADAVIPKPRALPEATRTLPDAPVVHEATFEPEDYA